MIPIPNYDSSGNLIGTISKECILNANAFVISNAPGLAGKVGFRFNKGAADPVAPEKITDYYFVDIPALKVLRRQDYITLAELIRETSLQNESCPKLKLKTPAGKSFPFAVFDIEKIGIDTPAHFVSLTGIVLHQYYSDFIKAHYSVGVETFYEGGDSYNNFVWKKIDPIKDTISYNVITNDDKQISKQIIRTLKDDPENAIVMRFDKTEDPVFGCKYAGVCHGVFTSSGIDLGCLNIFISDTDRKNYFSNVSLLTEKLLSVKYQ